MTAAIFERAVAFAHYGRTARRLVTRSRSPKKIVVPDDMPTGLPLGGIKGRMNQMFGRHADACSFGITPANAGNPARDELLLGCRRRCARALRPHRVDPASDSTMGGWYDPLGHYLPEELGRPSGGEVHRRGAGAEDGRCGRSVNYPLHLHPVLNQADIYHDSKPTRIAFTIGDVRQLKGSLPRTEALAERSFGIPWFKHYKARGHRAVRGGLSEGYAATCTRTFWRSKVKR